VVPAQASIAGVEIAVLKAATTRRATKADSRKACARYGAPGERHRHRNGAARSRTVVLKDLSGVAVAATLTWVSVGTADLIVDVAPADVQRHAQADNTQSHTGEGRYGAASRGEPGGTRRSADRARD
jgi:hypothetical protein